MEKQQLDVLTKKYTGFTSFDNLVGANIIPTISPKMWEDKKEAKQLAKAFDRVKRKQGSSIRAFREKDVNKLRRNHFRLR